ncbi:metal-dependent phosphohydrolase [Massilia sp. PAMC28688]|uniref:HD-GYP domain-containing protein n=1 Tax=Massilia sp. PAMC28688 TaxID=2861283 RepID=UPI001C630086|nr:HD domain-containing phosphohydrolase [Massilia sp. PAMC28688]QYF93309.1 metal-dependent phosphohydrolase [Massilia sp. PAMC28688]
MAMRRLTPSDIPAGQPLAWDVYSAPAAAHPLVRKGEVLAPGQLDGWIGAGLYADAGPATSVLLQLNQVNLRLDRMLMDLREQGHGALRALAGELAEGVARAPDVALAAIFLNQIAGAYPVRHCTEAAIIACLVARSMDKTADEVLVIAAAAMTMNVSMVREAGLFQDRDDALSSAERALLQRHPAQSVDKLRWAGVDDEAWLDLVLLHHENDDGSGYPHGKLGADISHNARLIALADRYCAFVSARNYRKSLLPPEALQRLAQLPVDPAMVARFCAVIGPFPPGTLVRLHNGECGVVTSRVDGEVLRVHILRDAQGPLERIRLTSDQGCAVAEALPEDGAGLRFSMKQVWGELASV